MLRGVGGCCGKSADVARCCVQSADVARLSEQRACQIKKTPAGRHTKISVAARPEGRGFRAYAANVGAFEHRCQS